VTLILFIIKHEVSNIVYRFCTSEPFLVPNRIIDVQIFDIYHLHGAEFLRRLESISWSRNSPPLTEPGGSFPCPQEPSAPSQPTSLRSIQILSFRLRIDLPSGFSRYVSQNFVFSSLPQCVLVAPPMSSSLI